MTRPLAHYDADERLIDDDIRHDELTYGHQFAHAGEVALPVGTVVYNFQGHPTTITKVRGRRFIWTTSDAYPEPHLIDWRMFSLTPNYDDRDTLVEHVIKHEGTGR